MKKNSSKGTLVFVIIVILALAFSGFRYYKYKSASKYYGGGTVSQSGSYDKSLAKIYKNAYVAALYIEGTIESYNSDYDQQWLLSTISHLKNDYSNKALAIFINSPGGAVYQADEVYLALEDYKTAGKPIYVYQGSMAASGGYYISCAADKIYANRNTLTGCIGVIFGSSYDLTGLFEKVGIKTETVHSGKNKNMFNYNEPVTEEQRKIMQAISDECYEQFVSIVAKSRGYTYAQAESLSDGRLYTAKQALENGLIDRIDSWENMIADLTEDEIEKPGIKIVEFRKQKKMTFRDFVMSGITEFSNAQTAGKLGLPKSVVEDMNGFNSYPAYLYRP